MKRSPLDSEQKTLSRMTFFDGVLKRDFLNNDLDLKTYFEGIKSAMEKLDKKASEKYSGEDLVRYAARMNFCVRKLKELEEYVGLNNTEEINIIKAVPIIAYLMADLKGLEFTLWEKQEALAS
jgi:hypothetical protein